MAGGLRLSPFFQYASTPYVSSEHEMFAQFDDASQPRLSKEDVLSSSTQPTQRNLVVGIILDLSNTGDNLLAEQEVT
ncbi:uncharacterized protein J3R85_008288 [Psidium guajava]|nr:uncharacterized protein J3R85_008288 [Psidium guajava]